MEVVGDLPVPYTTEVKEKVQAGKRLEVKGGFKFTVLTPDFAVNLLSKTSTATPPIGPNGEVVLQVKAETTREIFPPKLVTEIVANTYQGGKWGKELRVADPFGLGPLSPKVLDFAIDFKEDHFELIANNEKFTEFKYVIPIDHIDHIEITGDVTLSQVNWKTSEPSFIKANATDELDFYHPVGYPLFLASKNQKRPKKQGKIRKYIGKAGERGCKCLPCCK